MLATIRKFIPKKVFTALQPFYHLGFSTLGAIIYRFPARKLTVIAVTGTKGKSSTTEIINSIFEASGAKTAVVGTIRFKIGDKTYKNLYKMTTPGRFFLQHFLRKAVNEGCTHAILEMSSEAAKQYRHLFLNLNALVFLNLSPEHIESHGSYQKYVAAKLSIAKALARSKKKNTYIIANAEDKEAPKFLATKATRSIPFTLKDAEPYFIDTDGHISFIFKGEKIVPHLRGLFNIYNILAAATCADAFGISTSVIKKGVEKIQEIPGRVQSIKATDSSKQNFEVIVDYAHTADSLLKLYSAFEGKKRICILGNTGGGRDKWKRPEMAKVADTYCDEIIFTNEDPYDEDPRQIIEDMLPGVTSKPYEIEMDRRTAIRKAITRADAISAQNNSQENHALNQKVAVLISGKGTDPYIMEANDKKTPWSDAQVAKEELDTLFNK